MEDEKFNSISITGTAATIATLLGAESPRCAEKPISHVLEFALRAFGKARADRVFMYNPDAIAMWIFQKYTELFEGVFKNTQLGLPLKTVMPSVTPVCFASMYTGAVPAIHGIQSYTKPVLKTDTVFDALIRAGKKPVIVATEGDSMSKIFLEREMDYFFYPSVDECNEKAFELIEKDEYDLIALYNGNYDGKMHKFSPEGTEAIDALKANVKAFEAIGESIRTHWKNRDAALFFAPDHGCHEIDGGLGSHGLEMPEDMNIMHFYGMFPAR